MTYVKGGDAMRRAEITCMALGAAMVAAGVGFVYWPAALIIGGVALVAAGWPKDGPR